MMPRVLLVFKELGERLSREEMANDLTESQHEAVTCTEGPLLVLAGPGSGKTRVIARRIARIVAQGIPAHRILAITFTNKAAEEMVRRVGFLTPDTRSWIGTFHRFCARMLRKFAPVVGLRQNFSILDTFDQSRVLRLVMNEENIDTVHYRPQRIASRISKAKNALQSAEMFVEQYRESIGNHFEAVTARVYPKYQSYLLESNAVDFDDLLLHMVTVLEENPEIRHDLDRRFQYVLVDEYQDTNLAQYRIVRALSVDHPNLCVTGDPDQSIYRWRGAEIGNILRFEKDYPKAKVVRLEDNFRSTKAILKSADELISHNVHRKKKSLVTQNEEGEPVELLLARDGRHEADCIAERIQDRIDKDGFSFSDFAIFFRVNALSREFERAFSRYKIPYQLISGLAFFERAEIKDLLAYLRLIHNPDDKQAFHRVVNVPRRRIGKKTIQKLTTWATEKNVTLIEAAGRVKELPRLSKLAKKGFESFSRLIAELCGKTNISVVEILQQIVEETAYLEPLKESATEEDKQKLANIDELFTAASQYDRSTENPSLEGFLESTSLQSDADSIEDECGKVTLMTLHASKGLEYPVVYIVGVEQNLIPHERSLQTNDLHELEEERRLLFVGMTRAKKKLVLTQTHQREIRGRSLHTIVSEFLAQACFQLDDMTLDDNEHDQCTHEDFDDSSNLDYPDVEYEQQLAPVKLPKSKPRLMTAADLLNGHKNEFAEPFDLPQGFKVGMTVRHPEYGLGTVVKVSGFSKRRTVTVDFDSGELGKTYIASKSPLQPVGL